MAYAGIGLVVLQLGLVGLFSFKPPEFKAGYHEAPVETPETVNPPQTDYDSLRQLEAILSPAPVLAWAEPASDYSIPNMIAPDVLLDFGSDVIDAEEDTASKEKPTEDETTELALALTVPRLDLNRQTVIESLNIEPVYIQTLPDMSELDVKQRKRQFIAFMLPLILRANQEIDDRRQKIDVTFNAGLNSQLIQWAELYNVKTASRSAEEIHAELMRRVQPVPVSIALAQGAVESGWGTSRFAIQGNAIYGQWAWSADAGIKPKDGRYENAVIRSFANLFDSVRAYMHNLNTHRAYAEFRTVRHQKAGAAPHDLVPALLDTLDQYSEKRQVYINTLIDVMNDNQLWTFDYARLTAE